MNTSTPADPNGASFYMIQIVSQSYSDTCYIPITPPTMNTTARFIKVDFEFNVPSHVIEFDTEINQYQLVRLTEKHLHFIKYIYQSAIHTHLHNLLMNFIMFNPTIAISIFYLAGLDRTFQELLKSSSQSLTSNPQIITPIQLLTLFLQKSSLSTLIQLFSNFFSGTTTPLTPTIALLLTALRNKLNTTNAMQQTFAATEYSNGFLPSNCSIGVLRGGISKTHEKLISSFSTESEIDNSSSSQSVFDNIELSLNNITKFMEIEDVKDVVENTANMGTDLTKIINDIVSEELVNIDSGIINTKLKSTPNSSLRTSQIINALENLTNDQLYPSLIHSINNPFDSISNDFNYTPPQRSQLCFEYFYSPISLPYTAPMVAKSQYKPHINTYDSVDHILIYPTLHQPDLNSTIALNGSGGHPRPQTTLNSSDTHQIYTSPGHVLIQMTVLSPPPLHNLKFNPDYVKFLQTVLIETNEVQYKKVINNQGIDTRGGSDMKDSGDGGNSGDNGGAKIETVVLETSTLSPFSEGFLGRENVVISRLFVRDVNIIGLLCYWSQVLSTQLKS